ncbi:hypothetical protein F0U62_31655 [Cystobacter fuscus]|uniref:hypothetical protein n=1 Tax=Cystobacter fuscus TaxID=43 RepID=UPI002B311749|nr:hypothetical protein F0U62_31655 [Cystobacter fuscus]
MTPSLNRLYRENIDEAGLLEALEPVFAAYARDRRPGEGFGDFTVRSGLVATPGSSQEVSG